MVSAPEETSRGDNKGSRGPPEMSQSVTLEFQGKANLVRSFKEITLDWFTLKEPSVAIRPKGVLLVTMCEIMYVHVLQKVSIHK